MTLIDNKDVFDVTNVTDVPFELPKRTPPIDARLLEIYTMANGEPLTYNQLRVAYYRLYKEEKTNKQISARVSTMVKRGEIVLVSRGVYKLAQDDF